MELSLLLQLLLWLLVPLLVAQPPLLRKSRRSTWSNLSEDHVERRLCRRC